MKTSRGYNQIRESLLKHNFFVHRLILTARQELGIPSRGFKNPKEISNWEMSRRSKILKGLWPKRGFGTKSNTRVLKERLALFNEAERELYRPITKLLEKFNNLDLDYRFIKALVLGYKNFAVSGSSKVYIVTSSEDPIKEPGVYIKFTPSMTDKKLLEKKKEAKKAFELLQKIVSGKISRSRREQIGKRLKKPIKIYIEIEERCKALYSKKPALCTLENVLNELAKRQKVKKSTLRSNYYKVKRRFKLPSITKISKLLTYKS